MIENRRLAFALLLSLVIHALVLSMTFGGEGLGLPGFGFPWQDRRIEAPDLVVTLAPPQVALVAPTIPPVAVPTQQAPVEQPAASRSIPIPSTPPASQGFAIFPSAKPTPEASPAQKPKPTPEAKPAQKPKPAQTPKPAPMATATPKATATPARNAAVDADIGTALPRAEAQGDAASIAIPELPVIDVEPSGEAESPVLPSPGEQTSEVTVAPSVSSAQPAVPAHRDARDAVQELLVTKDQERAVEQAAAVQEAARQEAARLEAARIESERLAAQRQEAARQAAAELEATRQESARREAARIELARLEAQRQEAARIESARLEAQRQEAERQAAEALEAQRQEAARQEAARIESARLEAQRQEAARQAAAALEAQRQEAARQEAARIESARLEAQRQEAARQAAAALEAQRQEAARQEAARIESQRLEAQRQEAARRAAAALEAQRQEAARQEAARIESVRQEAQRREAERQAAAREEAARQEAARQEAVRQATARQEAARLQADQQEARREERLRAIGRQLDEEAARREGASADDREPNLLPRSLSIPRRIKLFGRTHPNADLIQYAEAWALRIQLNTAAETVGEVAKRPHRDPLVTVAIRSDGSVESVMFEISSGVAEVDQAIRRIVESQKPYVAFPRALARDYDVVEIRRTWHFDTVIRLD